MKFVAAGVAAGFIIGLVLLALGGTNYRLVWAGFTGLPFPRSDYVALLVPALAGGIVGWALAQK